MDDVVNERLYPILEGKLWGFIDRSGREVVAPRFKSADPFRDGLARVKGDKRFGFVDAAGALAIDGLIEAYGFSDGRAKARRGTRFGYLGKDGRFAIEPRFAQCEAFREGYAAAQDGDTLAWGVIDVHGAWRIAPGPLGGAVFSEGLAARRDRVDGTFGYIDAALSWVIPPRFSLALPFSEGLAVVEEAGARRIIDREGHTVITEPGTDPGGMSEEQGFHDGRALAKFDGLLGYLGWPERGVAIAPRFRRAGGFHEGRAMVGPDDGSAVTTSQGYIDTSGQYVVKPVLYTAGRYEGGLAKAYADPRREQVFGYIDRDGRWVWQPARGFAPALQQLRA